jgi:dTDP-4-amino-4,6-dideoxygalactose transaminase
MRNSTPKIPFNKPYMTGKEIEKIGQAHQLGHLAGDGFFTKQCQCEIEAKTNCLKALLVHSCTAALEMAALLADISPGDEVILPSYTFVSTANAFVLRGAVPVFVDIRSDTLNIDENLLEAAITSRTKAIVPVHYAGVACEMNAIMDLAASRGLMVIEDSAQGFLGKYGNRPLGSIGNLGALSFHETKNIISGEGGALLLNDQTLVERAEIIREKGTNRSRFYRGQIDKYTWEDLGSSYLPSEIIAAFLSAQLEQAETITARRLAIWETYQRSLEELERREKLRLPIVPKDCEHNAHMFYIILPTHARREAFLQRMKAAGISCVFHYVPLHNSQFGATVGRNSGNLKVTSDLAERIVRLPLWLGVEEHQDYIIETVFDSLS